MTFWQQIALILIGTAFSLLMNLLMAKYLFRWRKQEEKAQEIPSDFMERFQVLEEHVGNFRERITRVETKLNGSAWKPGGINQ